MFINIDKKKSIMLNAKKEGLELYKSQYKIKKHNLIKEDYTRNTLLGLFNRMTSELHEMKKEVLVYKEENTRCVRNLDKEEKKETDIKEFVNKIYNKAAIMDKVL